MICSCILPLVQYLYLAHARVTVLGRLVILSVHGVLVAVFNSMVKVMYEQNLQYVNVWQFY